ncbi:MAG: DUF998 domain-containing protein [Streptosporangiales bacterium]|nr:DUF998 domain-containing protein [Streptosporangiales bacterium]
MREASSSSPRQKSTRRASTRTSTVPSRTLLICGVVAGPVHIVVAGLQMLTRDGFDIGRHPASLLSNGDLGWIQMANFAVTGLLFVAGAIGLHRVLGRPAGRGGTWGPRLIALLGAGMVGAAVFSADPVDGFPPGTPLGPPTTVSVPGLLHFLVAAVAFIALIAACFVFARRFAAAGRKGWAWFSRGTGALFLVSWLSIFALPGNRAANTIFAAAIAIALTWAFLLAARRLTHPAQE